MFPFRPVREIEDWKRRRNYRTPGEIRGEIRRQEEKLNKLRKQETEIEEKIAALREKLPEGDHD